MPAAKLLQCERTANLQKSGFKRPDIGGPHGSGHANALNVKLLLQLRYRKNAQAVGGFYRLQKRSRAEKAAFPGQAQGQLHAVTVLHLMSIAHEAGAELTLEDFDRISREVPYLCNIKPSGKYPMEVFHAHGGVQAVLKAIAPKLDPSQLTVTGKTVLENLAEVPLVQDDVIFPLEKPKKPEGGLAILHGNLAPDGAVVKKAGVKPVMYRFTGKARVFDYMEDACKAIQNDEIAPGTVIVLRYEGPKGGPGMREQHMVTSLLVGRGMDESCALITDGRFSGSTRGPAIGHISPEAAAGGPIAAVQNGDEITIDIPNRTLQLHISDEELAERLRHVKPLIKPRTPSLAKYAALVTSADRGAILEIPDVIDPVHQPR